MNQTSDIPESIKQAVRSADVFRISSEGLAEKSPDSVIIEQPITVMIDTVGSFTIMATPSDIEALAVGFVFSEGLIDGIEDVVEVSTKPNLPNVVGIAVHDPTRISIQRNMIIASSCGMCGKRNIEKTLSKIPACGLSLRLGCELLMEITERLRAKQQLFNITGASHAAGIFDSTGMIISFSEDLGRHSALDKAIGKCLLDKIPTKGCGVALSGRVSLEMVTKAAGAGIELIVAVSAPSSFAIDAANRWNITLCGFVRQHRGNVYTHPERIE